MNKDIFLPQEVFEACYLFESNSLTNKTFDKFARPVFANMVQGLGINTDDFEFMVFDDGSANAFFLSGDKTKNGKNLIAVSLPLLVKLSTYEELAAVMAHECGHYIWEHTLGGKNSIFQERSSDLYAVNLLMNGGYNPVAIINAYQKIFSNCNYKITYDDVTLDIHGNKAMRLDDVRAYLTKIANERGYFEEVKTFDEKYSEDVRNIKKFDELTCDFFTREVYKKFKTADVYTLLYGYENEHSVSRLEFFRFLYQQLDTGNIDSDVRATSFLNMFNKINFFELLTKEEVALCREIFIKYQMLPVVSKENAKHLFDMMNTKEQISSELFGPFKEQSKNLQLFIDSAYDEEQAEKYAEICVKQEWIRVYISEFKDMWPKFNGLGEKNIGKKLPWVQMAEYKGRNTKELLKYLIKNNFVYHYSFPDYVQDKYLIEEDIVVAYGDKVQELVYDRAFEKFKEKIMKRIAHLDMMMRVERGEVSVAQYSDFIEENGGLNFVSDFVRYPEEIEDTELINKSDKAKKFLGELYEMDFFKNIIARNQVVKKIKVKPNAVAEKLALYTSGQYLKEIRVLAAKTLGRVAEYKSTYVTQEEEAFSGTVSRIYSKIHSDILGPDISYDVTYGLISNILSKKNIELKYFDKNPDMDARFLKDALRDENEKFKVIRDDVWYDIANVASKNELIAGLKWGVLSSAIDIDFRKRRKSVVLENIMKIINGIKEPQSADKFWDFIQNKKIDSVFKYLVMVNYILGGKKFYVPGFLNDTDVQNVNSTDISQIFSQYVADNNAFGSENIDMKIQMYMGMLKRGLFSEKMANKNEFAKIIVDELVSVRDFNSPRYKKNVEYVHDILMRKLLVKDSDNDFEFINEREKLIDFYADYWAQILGRDDGSAEYLEKIQPVIDLIKSRKKRERIEEVQDTVGAIIQVYDIQVSTVVFSQLVANSFVRKFTDKIVAQRRVADVLDKAKIRPVDGKLAEKYDFFGRGAEALISVMARTPNRAQLTIEFLSNKFSQDSYDNYIKNMDYNNVLAGLGVNKFKADKYLGKENLMALHENFWVADLPIRAVIINRLLNAAYSKDNEKINMILDMFFDKNSEYRPDAELVIRSVYYNLKDYERDLIVSAIICAGQRDENNNISGGRAVGQGLKMFLQNKGSAFIKFGQLLSYMPNLDSEIRQELATMRDKADIPSRYDLFQMIGETLPQSVRDDITDVGEILGAGSFYVTVKIKYQGQDCVVSLMRPNVAYLTSSGMEMIDATINDIVEKDSKYKPLNKIVKQARASAESEIDIEADYKKYLNAVDLYENLRVSTPTGDYSPDVAKWLAHGKNPNGTSYKIMEMSPGGALTSDEWTVDEKHDFAVAYVTLELCILLSGQQWDTDRHQGQQNFYNHAFRDFVIGIFDTAAQMDEKPNMTDKVMLGMMLFDMIEYEKSGRDLSDVLMQETNEKFANRFGATPTYIDGVKRGLTALSDIIEYQKEIKDENGNIIQESKKLTRNDMQDIISAVIKSGIVSKTVLSTIGARAIISGMVADMAKYAFRGAKSSNPIKVEYNKKKNDKKSKRIDKSKQELEKLIEEKNKDKVFGIDEGYIKKD